MQKIYARLSGVNIPLTFVTTIMVVCFLSFIFMNPEMVDEFAGYLIWVVALVTIFTLLIAFTPYGSLRLGKDNERPEFSRFSWFSMLFGAGVGTGILFFGVAEPISHLQNNPFLSIEGAEPLSSEAAIIAQRITLFHWGLNGWACYSVHTEKDCL